MTIMENLSGFAHGLAIASSFENLSAAFIGCLLGTLIGVLPGIGPLATVSILLSVTLHMEPLSALIMLAGIFYGAQYGGSTTAILCRLPGETTSVVTCLDGYELAKQGKAGKALATAAIASLIGGVIATFVIVLLAPPLAKFAIGFNAPEHFALMLLGLVSAVVFSGGSLLSSTAMIILGVLLGMVGTDVETGHQRFTMGVLELTSGIDIVPVVMGLFGLSEIVRNLSTGFGSDRNNIKVNGIWPGWQDLKDLLPSSLRGSAVGAGLGVLPGGGLILAPFASYMMEKRLSKTPEKFGLGAIEGVAGPEAANNASAQTSFIPLLTLGIPSNPVVAVMLGAMIMHGIQPGPQIIAERPDQFWGLIASMIIGNIMLVVINLPMLPIWVRLLKVPYSALFPIITIFCCVGAFTISNSMVDLFVMSFFTLAGIWLIYLGFNLIPLLLGFVLGPLAEENLRRAMQIADGNVVDIISRPITATLLVASILIILLAVLSRRKLGVEAFAAE